MRSRRELRRDLLHVAHEIGHADRCAVAPGEDALAARATRGDQWPCIGRARRVIQRGVPVKHEGILNRRARRRRVAPNQCAEALERLGDRGMVARGHAPARTANSNKNISVHRRPADESGKGRPDREAAAEVERNRKRRHHDEIDRPGDRHRARVLDNLLRHRRPHRAGDASDQRLRARQQCPAEIDGEQKMDRDMFDEPHALMCAASEAGPTPQPAAR